MMLQSGTACEPASMRTRNLPESAMPRVTGTPTAKQTNVEFLNAVRIQFQSFLAFASAKAETKGLVAMYARSTGAAMILYATTKIVTYDGPSSCVMMSGWL